MSKDICRKNSAMLLKRKLFYVIAVLILVLGHAYAQTGKINGKVIDAKTGETLPGASVLIEGTTQGAATDLDGNYSISHLQAGTYTLICRYVSYADKKIANVLVKENEVTQVNISLQEPVGDTLVTVEITATYNHEGQIFADNLRKKEASVSDVLSSDIIKKTPDRTAGDAVKRITGASIQDNKFVVIRGLSDRYNAAYINGAPLPSSESDRRAFAFDIFPANMLDNLVILKTATPELPGDFAGGVIQINTKSIPDKNQQQFSISSTYNTLTTFKPFYTHSAGKYDWIGLDDGRRALPKAIPSNEEYKQITDNFLKAEYAKSMKYDWWIFRKQAMPALSAQYSLARNFSLFKRDAGVLVALSYQNNPTTNYQTRSEFDDFPTGAIKTLHFNDTVCNRNILSSALINFSYKLNDNNQVSMKNLFSINSDDRVNVRKGASNYNDPQPTPEESSVRWFTQNMLSSSQLMGDHLLPKSKIRMKWVGGYSKVERDIPAMMRNVYQYDYNLGKYLCLIADNTDIRGGGNMFYSNMTEAISSIKYDISVPFAIKKTKHEFKAGVYLQNRNRDFNARSFKFTPYKKGSQVRFDGDLLQLPDNQIFAVEHMGVMEDSVGPYNGGFKLTEITKVSDGYSAASNLQAGYLMVDSRVHEKHRLVWGARIESYRQQFHYTEEGSNIDRTEDTTVVDILPSVNYIFNVTEKMNLRASYYRTVSRPEFRELAPFQFYNFIQLNIWSGDPKLKRALVENFDIRYEWFPGASQVVSVTGFYKHFTNPIESIQRAAVSGDPELYYTNIRRAENYGTELEYRIKLDFLTKNDSSIIWPNTTLFTNLTLIKSQIDNKGIIGAVERPLQGQSPYIVNAGIQYTHPTNGLGFNVSYNVVGPRIFVVGNSQEPDVWEKQRNVIDLQLVKTFYNQKLELKFNARDILAQQQIFYQDINNNRKADKATDDYTWTIKYGPSFSVNLSLKF